MLILVITTALFRDYNIGGIRSTAMAGSIFLGLANLWNFAVLWHAKKAPDASLCRPLTPCRRESKA